MMNKKGMVVCFLVIVITVSFISSAIAADWRFPVALTYISGWSDVKDLYEDNLDTEGYSYEEVSGLPVGLSFQPYVELDKGFAVGGGVGPLMLILGDWDFFDLPLRMDFRYIVMPQNDTAAYFRIGPSFHLASGDYVESDGAGIFVGAGVEFLRTRRVGMGIELAYDSAEVEFKRSRRDYWGSIYTEKEKIKPCEFMFSVFAIF
ncbi:MAG: hypothetical protein ACMUIU_08500 [bacterium]